MVDNENRPPLPIPKLTPNSTQRSIKTPSTKAPSTPPIFNAHSSYNNKTIPLRLPNIGIPRPLTTPVNINRTLSTSTITIPSELNTRQNTFISPLNIPSDSKNSEPLITDIQSLYSRSSTHQSVSYPNIPSSMVPKASPVLLKAVPSPVLSKAVLSPVLPKAGIKSCATKSGEVLCYQKRGQVYQRLG